MKKLLVIFLLFSFLPAVSFSQKLNTEELKALRKKEDSLKVLVLNIVRGENATQRFVADSEFTKMFVRTLKIHNSFLYRFDSLLTISHLMAEDSSFKIFTWQLVINDDETRQHGAIQMRTSDGSLKLFPLIDKSDIINNTEDTVSNNFGWIGAVYYKIIETSFMGENFYTLLGFDENDSKSNKKYAEVLTFKDDEPIFGGPYFSYPNSSLSKKFLNRFVMEYKKNAGPRLAYDTDQDMIIFEHTISETGEPEKKYTYIPDGDYDAFQWKEGKWVHIEKIFTQKLEDGQAPVPKPIRDAKGKIDETKLQDNETQDSTATDASSIKNYNTQELKKTKKIKQK